MEALADLAHCQATIGEFTTAQDLFEQSLERAKGPWRSSLVNLSPDGASPIWLKSAGLRNRHAGALRRPPRIHCCDVPAPAQLASADHDLTELKTNRLKIHGES